MTMMTYNKKKKKNKNYIIKTMVQWKLTKEMKTILQLFSVTTLLGILLGSLLANLIDRVIIPLSETHPFLKKIKESMTIKLSNAESDIDLFPIFLKGILIIIILLMCVIYYHFFSSEKINSNGIIKYN
jgi:hypothetical protein